MVSALWHMRELSADCVTGCRVAVMRRVALMLLVLIVAGCSSTGPAPVYGWGWSGPVPDGYYQVRRGDTLSQIAEQRGTALKTLARWNGLKSPYTIYAGSLLRVESPAGRPSAPARTLSPRSPQTSARTPPKQAEPAARRTSSSSSTQAPPSNAGSRRAASGVPWEWPLNGPLRQTFRDGDRTRAGIRIGARAGQPVRAAADGEVVYSGGGLKGYGNLIIIKHSEKYLSAYGFNRRLLVSEGESVTRGQTVAEVGQGAEGAYLMHFEIRRHGTAVDPLLYLPARNQSP